MKVIKKKIQVIIGDHKKKSSPMPSPTRREIISMVKVDNIPEDALSNLPQHIIRNILVHLYSDIKDIFHFMLLNKSTFLIGSEENVWQDLCFHHYYLVKKTKDTWQNTFKSPPVAAMNEELYHRYEYFRVLSKDVSQVRNLQSNVMYATKSFRKSNEVDYSRFYYNWFEHPFLIKCYEFVEVEEGTEPVRVVVDFVERDLLSKFTEVKRFSKKTVQFIIAQILIASQFMYSRGVTCKCGTMEKIRLCNDGYIKLNWISREMLGIPLGHRVSIIDAYEYSAPEFVEGGDFNLSCLFWGFGCLMYELIQGEPLLKNTATNLIKLAREILTLQVSFSSYFDSDSIDLLGKLLEKDPKDRMNSFEECKNHLFFKDLDWNALLSKQLVAPAELTT